MFPGIEPFSKFIKILHSDASPQQVAGGAAFGMIIGLTPFWNIHNLIILMLVFVIRVNLGMASIFFIIFSILAFPLDFLSHQIGLGILNKPSLQQFWTDLYNIPTMTFTHFNNSIVMGSLILSLIFFVPVWIGMFSFVKGYRGSLKEKIDNLRVVKAITASSAYKWYQRVRDWTG